MESFTGILSTNSKDKQKFVVVQWTAKSYKSRIQRVFKTHFDRDSGYFPPQRLQFFEFSQRNYEFSCSPFETPFLSWKKRKIDFSSEWEKTLSRRWNTLSILKISVWPLKLLVSWSNVEHTLNKSQMRGEKRSSQRLYWNKNRVLNVQGKMNEIAPCHFDKFIICGPTRISVSSQCKRWWGDSNILNKF